MRHGTSNYKALKPFFEAADRNGGHVKLKSGEYMPLVIEHLYSIPGHGEVYSMTHYGEQNGDLMRDPDMELLVDNDRGVITPMTYRNDYVGVFQQVFVDDTLRWFRPGLMVQLDEFLYLWRNNIAAQGFNPELQTA